MHTCQPKTIERYRQLTKYITDATADEISITAQTTIASLKHVQLETALRTLMEQRAVRREHISARTFRHVAGVLQAALNEAFRLDLITVNPMLKIKLPAVEQREAEWLTPEQVRALRETCRGDWTFALVELALGSGCRRGELLAVQWSDINWATRTLSITQSLEQTAAGLRLKTTKSKKPRRFMLLAALQFQRDQQAEHRRQTGTHYQDRCLVFAQPDGDFLSA